MQIVKKALAALFNRSGKRAGKPDAEPANPGMSISEFVDVMKQSFEPDDYVLMTQFFHRTVLEKAKAGQMQERHKNVILSTLSANMLGKLTDGKSSYYYPASARSESNGSKFVFAYDCYVPVHMLIDHARSVHGWMSFLDGNRDRAFGHKPSKRQQRRGENERMGAVKAYMDSLNDIREHIKKPGELDARTDLNFFDKDHDAMPFFASALEMGGSFDFVMRPKNGAMPARRKRRVAAPAQGKLPGPS